MGKTHCNLGHCAYLATTSSKIFCMDVHLHAIPVRFCDHTGNILGEMGGRSTFGFAGVMLENGTVSLKIFHTMKSPSRNILI